MIESNLLPHSSIDVVEEVGKFCSIETTSPVIIVLVEDSLDELTQLNFSYAHRILRITYINQLVNYKFYVWIFIEIEENASLNHQISIRTKYV